MKRSASKTMERKSAPAVTREELLLLSKVLEEISRNYVNRLQREIQMVVKQIVKVETHGEFTRKQLKDLNHMVVMIRQLQLKPDRGRRKDLKKIDALIGELETYTENW